MKHKHHNPPRHRVGNHDNVVEVSVTCHAMFHYCEWKLWGHHYDWWAWKMLAGLPTEGMERPEHSKKMSGEGNPMYGLKGENHPGYGYVPTDEVRKRSSERMKANNPMDNPEYRKKVSEAAKKHTNNVKSYIITYANGKTVRITNLKKWGRENGYKYVSLKALHYGKNKRLYDLVSIQLVSP